MPKHECCLRIVSFRPAWSKQVSSAYFGTLTLRFFGGFPPPLPRLRGVARLSIPTQGALSYYAQFQPYSLVSRQGLEIPDPVKNGCWRILAQAVVAPIGAASHATCVCKRKMTLTYGYTRECFLTVTICNSPLRFFAPVSIRHCKRKNAFFTPSFFVGIVGTRR